MECRQKQRLSASFKLEPVESGSNHELEPLVESESSDRSWMKFSWAVENNWPVVLRIPRVHGPSSMVVISGMVWMISKKNAEPLYFFPRMDGDMKVIAK